MKVSNVSLTLSVVTNQELREKSYGYKPEDFAGSSNGIEALDPYIERTRRVVLACLSAVAVVERFPDGQELGRRIEEMVPEVPPSTNE